MRRVFRTSDGHDLSYVAEGQGPPLVLLHGWSQSAALFRRQVPAFAATHRVLALDFRGHGESDRRPGGYRISRFAKDLAELLDHESCGRASVLGWSMGASVLWSYIDLFGTGRLSAVVLVDEPAAILRRPGMDDTDAADAGATLDAAALADFTAKLLEPGSAAFREAFIDGMLTRAVDPALRRWIADESLRVEPGAAASLFVDHASCDWRDVIRRIDVPTLVFAGEASFMAVRPQRWIAAQIAGADLVVTAAGEGGSHCMFIEAPDPFNGALAHFLAKVERRADPAAFDAFMRRADGEPPRPRDGMPS